MGAISYGAVLSAILAALLVLLLARERVLAASQVRMRWIGHSLRAELAVTVDAALTVERAHHIAHDVEHRLMHTIPRLAAATVHTEPATGAEHAHDALTHHR